MRIIDKRSDYYDVGMKWDQSGYPVWVRKEQDIIYIKSDFTRRLKPNDEFQIIGVAGDVHLMVYGYKTVKQYDRIHKYIRDYTTTSFLYDNDAWGRLENRKMWGYDTFFDYVEQLLKDAEKVFEEYDTPIFRQWFDWNYTKIDIAPILKDFKFQQVLDAYQMYQKIDQYVGTHMTQEIETSVLSDDSKAKKAGFGDMYDFRRKPQEN